MRRGRDRTKLPNLAFCDFMKEAAEHEISPEKSRWPLFPTGIQLLDADLPTANAIVCQT